MIGPHTQLPARLGAGSGFGGLGGWLVAILLVALLAGMARWLTSRRHR